jgi:aspartate carbamoyltransferase catalytic subunit
MSRPATDAFDFPHRHLLGIEGLSQGEITLLLDRSETYVEQNRQADKKKSTLRGRTIINLFFEDSTRTRTSFELAGKRLGGDVINMAVSTSATKKGETLIDTARNIEAMGVDVFVIRHGSPGAAKILAENLENASVVNAGDGAHEHPTQALLDLYTIREQKGSLEGLNVAIVGDISHSRVARSNIWGLQKLGAKVTLVGPPTLVPVRFAQLGCEISHDIDDVIPRMDVLNMLRIQRERQGNLNFPSTTEYSRLFGLTEKRLERAKEGVVIMHPGPINRGVEISPEVADGPHSVVLAQVSAGVAVRMAVLFLVSNVREAANRSSEERPGLSAHHSEQNRRTSPVEKTHE